MSQLLTNNRQIHSKQPSEHYYPFPNTINQIHNSSLQKPFMQSSISPLHHTQIDYDLSNHARLLQEKRIQDDKQELLANQLAHKADKNELILRSENHKIDENQMIYHNEASENCKSNISILPQAMIHAQLQIYSGHPKNNHNHRLNHPSFCILPSSPSLYQSYLYDHSMFQRYFYPPRTVYQQISQKQLARRHKNTNKSKSNNDTTLVNFFQDRDEKQENDIVWDNNNELMVTQQLKEEMIEQPMPIYAFYDGLRSSYEKHHIQMQNWAERAHWQAVQLRQKKRQFISELYEELKRNIQQFNREQTLQILEMVKCLLKFQDECKKQRGGDQGWVAKMGYSRSLKMIEELLESNNRNIREFVKGLLQAMQMKYIILQINSAKIKKRMKREFQYSQTKRLLDLLIRDPEKLIC